MARWIGHPAVQARIVRDQDAIKVGLDRWPGLQTGQSQIGALKVAEASARALQTQGQQPGNPRLVEGFWSINLSQNVPKLANQ